MAGSLAVLKSGEPSTRMQSPSDNDLLLAIAERRDEDAFAELFRRYEKLAFNLAVRVTGERGLAEEALQEAMLSVWNSAAAYQPGNARAWLLCIVVRNALRLATEKRKRERNQQALLQECVDNEAVSPGTEAAERDHLVRELRLVVLRLPAPERQLVALFYGAGLSQHEIADELSIPQRTISFRLTRVLDKLRVSLAQAGFMAAAPLALTESLSAAITSGFAPAPAWSARVVREVLTPATGQVVRTHFRRTRRAQAPTSSWLPAGLAAALLAAGVLWWMLSRGPVAPLVPPPVPAVAPAITTASVSAPLRVRWNFERGPLKDIKLVQGGWRWQDGKVTGVAGMELTSSYGTGVLLPIPIPAGPVQLTVKLKNGPRPEGKRLSFFWTDGRQVPKHLGWKSHRNTPPGEDIIYRVYIIGRYFVNCLGEGEDVMGMQVYEPEHLTGQIGLAMHNIILKEIEVRSIAPADIPESLRDPSKLIHKMSGEAQSVEAYPFKPPGSEETHQ